MCNVCYVLDCNDTCISSLANSATGSHVSASCFGGLCDTGSIQNPGYEPSPGEQLLLLAERTKSLYFGESGERGVGERLLVREELSIDES